VISRGILRKWEILKGVEIFGAKNAIPLRIFGGEMQIFRGKSLLELKTNHETKINFLV
jgi:hypothetical protein